MPKDEIPASEIPEVAEYIQAREALDGFIEEQKEVFDIYSELVEHVNDSMQRADKAVRSKSVSCGPWDKYQLQTKYDAKALYEALGRDDFLRAGGKLNTITEYGVDKAKVDAAITRGDIPQEVAQDVKKISPRYKTPKEVGLP